MPSRILLDENLPVALKALLSHHDVRTVRDMGWLGMSNGRLLDAMKTAGQDAFVTADQGIALQQALAARRVAPLVVGTNRWLVSRECSDRILRALAGLLPGGYRKVEFPGGPSAGPPPGAGR